MKRLKRVATLLLVVSLIGLIGFVAVENINRDSDPPKISFDEEELSVDLSVGEEELLADVTATDDKDGDVSDTVVIADVSGFMEDGSRVITYAVADESGNVGKKERVLRYTDYLPPQFEMSAPLRFPVGTKVNVLENVTAYSDLDGDLTKKIKYTFQDRFDLNKEGQYAVELSVTDSSGTITYLPVTLEMYDKFQNPINVELNDYLVYLNVGDEFDTDDYYVGADQDGKLTVYSMVDTSQAGVYEVEYYVANSEAQGSTRQVVVVE